MQERTWLTATQLIFVTVVAIVVADLVSLGLRTHWLPAPSTAIHVAAPSPTPHPSVGGEKQLIADGRVLLGNAADVTLAPSPSASGAPGASGTTGTTGATAAVKTTAPIPDPSSLMSLIGTIVCPGASIAIMVINSKQVVLHEGDKAGLFTVAEIRDNSVVLEMYGQHRTLYMPSVEAALPTASPGPQGPAVLPPPPAPVVANPSLPGSGVATAQMSIAERDAAMSNLPVTLKNLRILPFKKNGVDYGSRVTYLKPGSFLSRVGLEQNDILLSVNDQPVNTPEQGLNVFQTFKNEDRIVMKIDRNGQIIQREVDFH